MHLSRKNHRDERWRNDIALKSTLRFNCHFNDRSRDYTRRCDFHINCRGNALIIFLYDVTGFRQKPPSYCYTHRRGTNLAFWLKQANSLFTRYETRFNRDRSSFKRPSLRVLSEGTRCTRARPFVSSVHTKFNLAANICLARDIRCIRRMESFPKWKLSCPSSLFLFPYGAKPDEPFLSPLRPSWKDMELSVWPLLVTKRRKTDEEEPEPEENSGARSPKYRTFHLIPRVSFGSLSFSLGDLNGAGDRFADPPRNW